MTETMLAVLTRRAVCEQCAKAERIAGRVACPYLGRAFGWCGEEFVIASPCMLEQAWRNPDARCLHPDGDQWANRGAATPAQPVATSGRPTRFGLAFEVFVDRVRCCKGHGDQRPRCTAHRDPWGCAASGEAVDVGLDLQRPGFACPRGLFAEVAA